MINTIFNEYNNLLERLHNTLSQMNTLPQGYISKKTIKGKQYSYLQNRVNGRLMSKYIKEDDVGKISLELELSKKYRTEIPKIEKRLLELEQAAKLVDKKFSRELMRLKLSFKMDMLTIEQKDKSISFANAMNSIEGVLVSNTTETKIAEWKNNQKSFFGFI